MAEPRARKSREYRSYSQFSDEPIALVPRTGELAEARAAVASSFQLLQLAFVLLTVLPGLDKFAGQLTNWGDYLHSAIPVAVGLAPSSILYAVGAGEILLSIGLIFRPRIFAVLTGVWMGLCALNHLVQGHHFDMALYSCASALGAYALARLSSFKETNQPAT